MNLITNSVIVLVLCLIGFGFTDLIDTKARFHLQRKVVENFKQIVRCPVLFANLLQNRENFGYKADTTETCCLHLDMNYAVMKAVIIFID